MSDILTLKGGKFIISHEKSDAWRINTGSVIVYIAPFNEGMLGRRAFLYEAKAGEVIPSLCFKDYEYTDWRFCLVAMEEAEVAVINGGNTTVLRNRFAQRAKLHDFEREGFDNAVINSYKMIIVAEDGLFEKEKQERKTTSENILNLIYNVFHKEQRKLKTKKSENPLFKATSIICNNSNIPLVPVEKINEACPDGFTIDDIARISHFSCREIVLDNEWHKSDSGALLIFDTNENPIACIPKGQNGYTAHYVINDESKPVSSSLANSINPKAYVLYRPLPNKSMSAKDLFHYCMKSINTKDIVQALIFTALCTTIGLLLPTLNQMIFDTMIPIGASLVILQLGIVIGSVMVAGVFFSVAKNILNFRVISRIGVDIQCAIQDRLFNLPENFFRKYESADLAQRVSGLPEVAKAITSAVLVTGLTALLSILYFIRMTSYSAALSWAAVLMLLVYALTLLFLSHRESKYQAKIQELDGKSNSILYQHINGIAKIRMSGAEDRALFQYMKLFVRTRELDRKRNTISAMSNVLSVASSSLFSIVLFWLLVRGGENISIGMFIAFTSAFGLFSAAFLDVFDEIKQFLLIKPTYERCKPILSETPEFDEAKELPGDLSGEIEINNVTFSYSPNTPIVLDNLSLQINSGEYIGVVGSSGCGKSTLLKLLLGFETPTTGKIYYDGKDIESLDKRELRKKMGVVLQDGKLISGSIFENITITSPKSTASDAQRVIREVGLENDIKDMPMGLHTVLSEDCGTISGGQQQRILIARAIMSKPGILLFDEATSALDNITQAMVCESLDKMNATRIVIAHRLSTIINCDRIIVMDAGKIVEQGNYQELMDGNGLFYELASRQIA